MSLIIFKSTCDQSLPFCWRQRYFEDTVRLLFLVPCQIHLFLGDVFLVDHLIDASSNHPNRLLPTLSLQVEPTLDDHDHCQSLVDGGYLDYTLEASAFGSCNDTDVCGEEWNKKVSPVNENK
jgi:hypothetical protein